MPANQTPKRIRVEGSPESQEPNIHGNVGQMSIAQFMQILDTKLSGITEKLSSSLETLVTENKEMKLEIQKQKKRGDELERRLEAIENKARRNNLIFRGVKIDEGKSAYNSIRELCAGVMGIKEEVGISRCFKIGRHLGDTSLLFVEFWTPAHADRVFQSARHLKGKRMSVQRDCAKEIRVIRSKLLKIRKEIPRVRPDIKTSVVNDKLYISNEAFQWSSMKGLLYGESQGVEVIKERYQIDLQNVLKNIEQSDGNEDQNNATNQDKNVNA